MRSGLRAAARLAAICAAGTIGAAFLARAEDARWTLEAFGGSAANVNTTLTVRQEGQPELEVPARWATRAFTSPFYWNVRAGRSGPRGGWELELLHHKIYLDNPTPEVSRFEITHGFNMVTLQRTWIRSGWVFRAGAGALVAHTESTVRGLRDAGSYELAGPALQVGVGRRFPFTRHFFGALEGKVTYAHAKVSVEGGKASASNVAFHGLFGLGVGFP